MSGFLQVHERFVVVCSTAAVEKRVDNGFVAVQMKASRDRATALLAGWQQVVEIVKPAEVHTMQKTDHWPGDMDLQCKGCSRMGDVAHIAVAECTAVAAALAIVVRRRLVDHRVYCHIARQLERACLASRPTFLLVSWAVIGFVELLTLLRLLFFCVSM